MTTTTAFMKDFYVRSASLFLILLICADLVFIALHTIHSLTTILENPLFSLAMDRGYSELYQYIKWLWITVLLGHISILRRSFCYNAWGLVFIYFLFDDALSIHETAGSYLAELITLTPPFGLRLQDIGELVISATAGTILLSLVTWSYYQGSLVFKKMSQDMFMLILALVFFGVVVDMLEIAIELGWKVSFILGVIEDGGEMLVASLILWYVFLLSVRNKRSTSYLIDFVRLRLIRSNT